MGNSYSNFAERRLKTLSKNGELEIGFVPDIDSKADKPEANKPPQKYSNPYEEYIKTWEPGDVIPLVPPGKRMHFCTFNPNMLDTDSTFFRSTHKHASTTKFKSGAPEDIEYKVLGRKLKDSLESLLRRAANARGLWVDDKNKLRCPPGTPAANQFTDITGSNCFIPTPRTAAQTGARAIRRATTGATQMATPTGGRVATGFDVARANADQIREMGFERVQEMMAYGGRIAPTPAMVGDTISGAMRSTRFGLIPDPSTRTGGQKRGAPKGVGNQVWQLGLKEQVWRGRRATELARSTRDRFNNPNRPDGLRLPPSAQFPAGRPIGDISQKAQFVSAMSELFPNVPLDEIEEMFDQAIPMSLSRMDRSKLKASLVQYWYSWMAEAIANPEQAKWVTSFAINTEMGSAFEVRFDAFAPSPSTGGRRISQTAANLAQSGGKSAEQGGVQFALHMNPWEMWAQVNRSGFDRNGRANGVADSVEGDMHYLATHEWGHLAHFSTVMETMGFQTQNLQRYPLAQTLVRPQQGTPQWQRQRQVNAWIIDFRQAANPTGNRSLQLLIDSAQNLSTRQYVRSGNWGNVTGYTRQDLETDLNNFHNALAEAIENNITDDADDQLLMRQFSGGVYAATSNIEARAEFYAARRMFGEPALTGGQTGIPSTVDKFAQTMAAAQGATQTAAQYRTQMDDIGQQTFGVPGNSWNISGRMAGSGLPPQRPTLKTQAVRRAVDQNYPRSNRNRGSSTIAGAMRSSSVQSRTTSSRDWKNQDTISSPNTNMPFSGERQVMPSMLQSALGAPQPSTPIVGRMSSSAPETTVGVRRRFDGSTSGDVDVKVYDINGEKIVFDNPDAVSIDDSTIKVIPKNPFEISGKANTSKEGREYSEKWLMAQLGRGDMQSNDVDALLYRASRGDADAETELDSLSAKGSTKVSDAEDKLYKPFEFDADQQRVVTQAGLDDLSVDDLYVVHETSYEPEVDENGDVSIAPRSNFEETAESGKKVRVPRHTIHFALNHLVGGHVFRQRSDKDTTILIAPLSQVLKDNPDALDNLYTLDTVMTPKPGEGIKLKAGTFRRITGTPDKEATEEAVRQQLNEMGATNIFKAESAESSTEAQDLAVRKIASQLKTQSGLHANIPSGMIENYLIRQAGSGGTADITLPPEWVAGMSRNHRQRVGDSNFWSDARPSAITGFMKSGSGIQGGESRIKKNKEGVPQYPRTPTYGPMLGETDNIFEGATSWEDFKQRYDDQEIVFLDYETTGLVFDKFGRALENGNPVEIGAIKVKNGQVIDRFNVFVNPGKPLQQWSKDNLRDADGNPLTDEYLQGMESLESGHRKLVEFAGPNAIMGVQNAAYDKNVLEDTLRENGIDWQAKGWIDLKDMAGMTLPRYSDANPDGPHKVNKDGTKTPSNGLADITRYLGVPLGKEHHRADKDAEATAESMRKLIDGAIEKNWSKDALDKNKRKAYVKRTQDAFDSDVKEWESELAKYLGEGVSGKMSSSSPALRSTPEFGKRQSRSYYSSLPSSKSWRPETLEQSEPARMAKRSEIIKNVKSFLDAGEGDPKYMSAMNGLDPAFADYMRNTEERELLADLRQAAVEFHAGIDQKPRLNVDAANIASIMETGLRRDDSNKPRRLVERKKAYEADIGISPDTPDADRPITGYMVHSDADFSEKEQLFTEFAQRIDVNSPRYKFDLFKSRNQSTNNGFNSVFGDAEIILKPEVGERTAYGNGDALDNHIFPVLANSSDSDEIGRALIDPYGRFDERESHAIELLYGKFKNDFNAYRRDNGQTRPQINGAWSNRDALIMGGIQASDIEEVRIPFRSLDTTNSRTAESVAKKPRELKYLPVSEYVNEGPSVAAAPPGAPPNPPDDNGNNISKEELDKLQEKMKRSYAATKDEQKIIQDIMSGVQPMNAIPKDLAIRIDNVNSFSRLAEDFDNLRRVEEAERLQALAKARGINLAITNDFGLDIFDGRSFLNTAPTSRTSKEVLEAKIDKQIEQLIEVMRDAKFKNIKNLSDSQKRLSDMQESFDKLVNEGKDK